MHVLWRRIAFRGIAALHCGDSRASCAVSDTVVAALLLWIQAHRSRSFVAEMLMQCSCAVSTPFLGEPLYRPLCACRAQTVYVQDGYPRTIPQAQSLDASQVCVRPSRAGYAATVLYDVRLHQAPCSRCAHSSLPRPMLLCPRPSTVYACVVAMRRICHCIIFVCRRLGVS